MIPLNPTTSSGSTLLFETESDTLSLNTIKNSVHNQTIKNSVHNQAIKTLEQTQTTPPALKGYEWAIDLTCRQQTQEKMQEVLAVFGKILDNVEAFNQNKNTVSAGQVEQVKIFASNNEKLTQSIIPTTKELAKKWIFTLNAHIQFWEREKRDIAEMWKTKSEGNWILSSTHSIEMRWSQILTALNLKEPIQESEILFNGSLGILNDSLIKDLLALLSKLVSIKEELMIAKSSYWAMPNPDEAYFDLQKYTEEFGEASKKIEDIKEYVTTQLTCLNDKQMTEDNGIKRNIIQAQWTAIEQRKRETEIALKALIGYGRLETPKEPAILAQACFNSRSSFRKKINAFMVKIAELKEEIHTLAKGNEVIKHYYKQELIKLSTLKKALNEEKQTYIGQLDEIIKEAKLFIELLNDKQLKIDNLAAEFKKALSSDPKSSYILWPWPLSTKN